MIIVNIKDDVNSINIICIFCAKNITFLTETFLEESSILVNLFIQGLVLSHVGLEWLEFKSNNINVHFEVRFADWLCNVLEYHDTVCNKLLRNIFEDLNFVTRDDQLCVKEDVNAHSRLFEKK